MAGIAAPVQVYTFEYTVLNGTTAMADETEDARRALVARVNDIPIHAWTGLDEDSDMYDFMTDLTDGCFDIGGITGPEFEMTPVKWPQGGTGYTLDYNSDSATGIDTPQENTTVFFTAGSDVLPKVHELVIVRYALTTLVVQLKITVGLNGERFFEGLSLAGDAIYSIPVVSLGRPYLCFAFVAAVKDHLLAHTQRINNSTKIVVLPPGAHDGVVEDFSDLMLL